MLSLVIDYTGLDTILKPLINDKLSIESKEHPILVTEPSLHNKEHRMKMATHFFEKHQVPAFFICKSTVLAAFANGRSTCVVLESGANTTYATPIQDGYALQPSMIKCDVGGNYLTGVVSDTLTKMGISVTPRYACTKKTVNGQVIVDYQEYELTTPSYEAYCKQEITCEVKEALLSFLPDASKVEYELPDGKKINLGEEAYKIPELMFTGTSKENSFIGVHKMIAEAIMRSDLDIRKELYANIVVTGGNTLIPGFVERVQQLVSENSITGGKTKVIYHIIPSERQLSPWLGGSILSSLGSFQQMWMSKQEFDEHGAIMIERKCA
jgi:actin-related protein